MKLRLNPGGPPPKAKYSSVTDSELVPRGKGEIAPLLGEWQNLKSCVYKVWASQFYWDHRMPFA